MKTRKILGKTLEEGDKVVDNSGRILTIQRLSPGMVRGSRLAHFKEVPDWTTVFNDVLYEGAYRDTNGSFQFTLHSGEEVTVEW